MKKLKYKLLAFLYNYHIEHHSYRADYGACDNPLCRFGWWLETATGEIYERDGIWFIKDV